MTREQKLEEVEKEITAFHKERERWLDYTIDLQRIIEALCDRRGLPEPLSTARHHYNMAKEFLTRTAITAGEEAGGKAVAWRWRPIGGTVWVTWNTKPVPGVNLAEDAVVEIEPLYIHPTPSPIVDDAMVERALVEWSKPNDQREPAEIMRSSLLAAVGGNHG